MQSSSQIIITNKPTPSFFTGWIPFQSPNQQRQIAQGKNSGKLNKPNNNYSVLYKTTAQHIQKKQNVKHDEISEIQDK